MMMMMISDVSTKKYLLYHINSAFYFFYDHHHHAERIITSHTHQYPSTHSKTVEKGTKNFDAVSDLNFKNASYISIASQTDTSIRSMSVSSYSIGEF